MEAVKVTPKIWIARVEVAKVAQGIGLSPKCDKEHSLFCGLARVRVDWLHSTVKEKISKKRISRNT